jgi:group II intron reverse transcriptase/maturase
MADALESITVLTKQQRIAEMAKQHPKEGLRTLAHHLDEGWLKTAYLRTRKDGAVGIDGQTSKEYEQNLEGNLRSLLERAKSGKYCAPPVKRVYIPKGNGEKRPLGIPTFEDKVLQRAIVMLLEPIYEQEFLGCSYGFRPGRSAHQALEEIRSQLLKTGGGWVLEVDIRKYFDTLDHAHLREILSHRIRDGVVMRLIGKWLNAGVLEEGRRTQPEAGTPQGGVISPLLSNIYLHEILDKWIDQVVKSRMKGRIFEIRFADDYLLGFTQEADARRVMKILPKRFEKYGLKLHPEKTRIVEFKPNRKTNVAGSRKGTGTFDFLGFTHYWGRSRKQVWVIKRKTASDRLSRAVKKVAEWCRTWQHMPLKEQQITLRGKMLGHYNYYGIRGNSSSLGKFHHAIRSVWRKWLSRRSREAKMNWEQYCRLLESYPLPRPRLNYRGTVA